MAVVLLGSALWLDTADVKDVVEDREEERERVRGGCCGKSGCGGDGGGFIRDGRVGVPEDLKVYCGNDMIVLE